MISRLRLTVALIVTSVLTAACAAIPSSGQVERVDDDGGLGQSTVRYTPAGPIPGASREQIMRGFLDAMLAYPVSHRVAAQYLTAGAARSWRPNESTTVYSVAQPKTEGASSWLELQLSSYLDEQGRLSPSSATERLEVDMVKQDGQWRINTAPPGVLVSQRWFDDYIRGFELYFLDESGRRVVPVPVYEVVGDQLATSLMTSIAIGPKRADPPGLSTAVGEAADLRSSVPIVDGVAEVEFSTRVGELSAAKQRQLSAQIAWTLRQVPGVTGIQVTGDGTVVAPAGDAVQDALGWASFGPDKSRRWVTAVVKNAVYQVHDLAVVPVSGPWGKNASGAALVTTGHDQVAAVWPDRARVTAAEDLKDTIEVGGDQFLRPVIDREAAVWLVDSVGGRNRIRVVTGAGPRVLAELPNYGLGRASSFAVSPDGSRYALVVDHRLYLGGIDRRGGKPIGLTEPVRLKTGQRVTEVAWLESVTLGYLADGVRQLQSVRIDGTGAIAAWPGGGQLLGEIEPVALFATAEPQPDVYLQDAAGGLWVLDRTRWVKVDLGKVSGIG
ncbi:MAG TPA: GerMN domain-containing protein [Aeromicrobium sp.]|nr:GerMN domain-containing protein [Aeromicrobium sp.]